MKNLIYGVLLLGIFAGALGVTPEPTGEPTEPTGRPTPTPRTGPIKCIQCEAYVDDLGTCAKSPNISANEDGIASQECEGSCYEEITKGFGQTGRFVRGCEVGCQRSDGCNNILNSGVCKRCCDSSDYCNVNLGLSAAYHFTANTIVITIAAILAVCY